MLASNNAILDKNVNDVFAGLRSTLKFGKSHNDVQDPFLIQTDDMDKLEGVLKYSNGDSYEGEFRARDYTRHGKGTYRFIKGCVYCGDWNEGQMEGRCVLNFSNSDNYEGEFTNGSMNGQGVMKFRNGDLYEGTFKSGIFHGYGKLKYSNGNVYEGIFDHGKRSELGILRQTNGNIYEVILINLI